MRDNQTLDANERLTRASGAEEKAAKRTMTD